MGQRHRHQRQQVVGGGAAVGGGGGGGRRRRRNSRCTPHTLPVAVMSVIRKKNLLGNHNTKRVQKHSNTLLPTPKPNCHTTPLTTGPKPF